jgi:hypothetical protein
MTTQELWQSQTIDAPRVTVAYLRGRASDTIRTARRRNLLRYLDLSGGLVAAILFWFLIPNPWIRAGSVCLTAAVVVMVTRWRRLATPASLPVELGALDTLRFHRHELERQHAAYRGYWRWLVPLFLPSMALMSYGGFLVSGGNVAKLVRVISVFAAGLAFSAWRSESKAANLRREIELLDLMAK